MAARGHVQDPNDRRLRPIYGKDSMESSVFERVWMFGRHPCAVYRYMCVKVEGVGVGGQQCGPTSSNHGLCCLQRPMTVHLTRSATEPGVGHGCLGETLCPRVNAVHIPGAVQALTGAEMFVVRFGSFSKSSSFLLTVAIWQLASMLIWQLATQHLDMLQLYLCENKSCSFMRVMCFRLTSISVMISCLYPVWICSCFVAS